MDGALVNAGAGAGERTLQLWASHAGVGGEVERLSAAVDGIKSVLAEARGKEIQNEALVAYIKEASHEACSAGEVLSELEYYAIQETVERGEDEPVHVITNQNLLQSTSGGETELSNDYVAGAVESTLQNSAFGTKDSDSAALQTVPFAANPMVPTSNTSLALHLDMSHISHKISTHIEQCCRMACYVRKALELENLDYCIAQKYQSMQTDPRETSPIHTEPKVYGRNHERDMIIGKLTNTESFGQALSIIAIVGHGGVGKTTLAKLIFNDPAVLKHFEILLWVYVSVHFDQIKIIRELLESLYGDRRQNIKELKELQDNLKSALRFKRVLLVLDDMWEDSQKEKWDELLTPLLSNDVTGNMVLVTTRKPSVLTMIGPSFHINLDGLNKDAFWCLFKQCAFGDENYKGKRKLEKIGQKIVVKLKGNPLAAKSVGKVLIRRLDVDYWTRVLDNSEWKNKEDDGDIMSALMISYKYLPVHLQQCFSYCAVFPKYHRYERERLVNMWIAQGMIYSTDRHRQPEDIGTEYFNDLVDWGFFEKDFGISSLLIMHDLIHDLAQNVSADESFTIEDSEPKDAPPLVRHVSVITERVYKTKIDGAVHPNESFVQEFSNSFRELQRRNLRTLMLFGPHDLAFSDTFRQELYEVRSVHVLKLEMVAFDLDSLIGNMPAFINLRYLELGCFYEGPRLELPEALCRLYHLQVLDIRKNWGASTVLPRGMSRLVNLRHFIAKEELHAQLAGVGKMASLQELKAFSVGETNEFSISQLKDLNQLRGSLSIYSLNNVGSEEAIEARLCNKVYLCTLHLSWYALSGNRVGKRNYSPVLEDLIPHSGLRNLHIVAYKHAIPSWLGSNFYLTSLQSLLLKNCLHWVEVPHPQQFPVLQELHLINLSRVKKVEIGSLKILELRRLQNLRQCIVLDMAQLSANLRILEVQDCPKLKDPLLAFTSSSTQRMYPFLCLHRLQIINDLFRTSIPPLLLLDSLADIDLCGTYSYFKFRLKLTGTSNGLIIQIQENENIQRLGERLFSFDKLKNLHELEIQDYPIPTCQYAWEGFQQLTSLKKLKMVECPKLFSINVELFLPPSIEELSFDRCNITGKQLLHVLLSLRSLKNFRLADCQKVTSLPVGLFTDEKEQMAEGSWCIPPNCLTTLERLHIGFATGLRVRDMRSSMYFSSKQGLGRFVSLKKIVIEGCSSLLATMISGGASHIPPSSLVKLCVTGIKDSLMQFSELCSLVELEVFDCQSLISLNLHSCTTLEKLCIRDCHLLSSLDGLQSCTALQDLSIRNCKVLPSLRVMLSSLKILCIENNPNLTSLELNSCVALQKLCIKNCPAMLSWEGLEYLIGLEHMEVKNSPGFIRRWISAAAEVDREHSYFSLPLQALYIDDIGILCVPICSQLTCLKILAIEDDDVPHGYVDTFTDNHEKALSLLTSLRQLQLENFKHLQSLPAELRSLTSLQRLFLGHCECITSLPVGGFPASLKDVDLYGCSKELNALCREICRVESYI